MHGNNTVRHKNLLKTHDLIYHVIRDLYNLGKTNAITDELTVKSK